MFATPKHLPTAIVYHPPEKSTTVDLERASPPANPSQAQLRHFRANDLQAVRDLFRTEIDTGRDSAREGALERTRFDATNLFFYSLIALGIASWIWAPSVPITPFPLSISAMGGLLAVLVVAVFAYRRRMVARAYSTFCKQSLASSDLRHIVGHYGLRPVRRDGRE